MSTTTPKPTLIDHAFSRLFDRVSEAFLKTRGWKLEETRNGPRYVKQVNSCTRFIYEKHEAIKHELTRDARNNARPENRSTMRGIHHA